jgi:hypothetical protein
LIIYPEQNRIGVEGVKSVLISVIYQNNKIGRVDYSMLDELISSNKIKKFLRFDGWVTIGEDPIRRGTGGDYKGRERRQHLKIMV